MPILWYVPQLAAVSLGVARRALDEIATMAQTKVPTFSTAVLADRPRRASGAGARRGQRGSGASFLRQVVDDQWREVLAGRSPTPRPLALSRLGRVPAVGAGAAVTRAAGLLAAAPDVQPHSSGNRVQD
jgi:hypothetical protein